MLQKLNTFLLDNNNKELLRNRIETPKNYTETITSIISIIKDIENKNKNKLECRDLSPRCDR